MRGKIRISLAIFLLIAATATIALVAREYRACANGCQNLYTRSVKKHDVVDAARNVLASVSDAEVREQDYVLTGETVYFEAYKEDFRTAMDELDTLQLVSRNDPAAAVAPDLSHACNRTLDELAAVLRVYEKSGKDAAIERIGKSSSIVYLDQVRGSVARIIEVDGGPADLGRKTIIQALGSLKRVAEGAGALFCVAAAASLMVFSTPRVRT